MSFYLFKKQLATAVGTVVNLDYHLKRRCDRYLLSYHRILTKHEAEKQGVHFSLWVSPEKLEKNIKWMQTIGSIVNFAEIVDIEKKNDRPWFTLTFDDGWKDNFDNALPILMRYNVPAIFFLATDALNTGELFWPQDIATKSYSVLRNKGYVKVNEAMYECWPEQARWFNSKKQVNTLIVEQWIEFLKTLEENERKLRIKQFYFRLGVNDSPLQGYILDWDDVKLMQKYGFNFGSHTHNHTIIKNLSPGQIKDELGTSKAIIENNLQAEINTFCYPNGRYNGTEGIYLLECGYQYACCLNNRTLKHCNDNFYIPRFLISENKIANPNYFKLGLMETPLYRAKVHNPYKDGE